MRTYTWTEHTFTCTGCNRLARACQETIDMIRRDCFTEGQSDAEIAAGLDFCFACVDGMLLEGEHPGYRVGPCEGHDDGDHQPSLIRTYAVTRPDDTTVPVDYCDDCAELGGMDWNGVTKAIALLVTVEG
jgi:hypothetical protein